MARVHRARLGGAGLGRRRQRVRRLPQRLRRDVRRAREPGDREGRQADRAALGTHFAAPTEGSITVAEELQPPLRPAAVAVHELRHRGDHGRDPPRARRHRPRRDHQDRGLLPRPPRCGDGVGVPVARGTRRARRPAQRPLRRRLPEGAHRPHSCRAVQRRRGARARPDAVRGARGRNDPRAGDDEHQHRAASRGLPRAGARADRGPRRDADLRRGQDRRDHLAGRSDAALRRAAGLDHAGEGHPAADCRVERSG